MEPRTVEFVVTACDGELLAGSPQTQILRVCTDSRRVQPGDLFVALQGERFDGHDFIAEVMRKKAAAVMTARKETGIELDECGLVLVDNTRAALGRLAAAYRNQFNVPAVAVAGSNGKTTAKELVASVLKQKRSTLWSEASFNNEVGVPLTLLSLEKTHRAMVVEVGTNHPGELAPLVRMVQPRFGIITSIAREHLEFFDDLAGVAKEQGVLAELLPPDGKLLLAGDSEWSASVAARSTAPVVKIGFLPGNDWRVTSVRGEKQGMTFWVEGPNKDFSGEYRVVLLGRHQAVNALFAIVLGIELGLSREAIERGLAECKPAKMRLQLWEHNGVRILDDAYNANADSMLAALQTLQDMPCKGRRVAVLGDMAELGKHSEAAHEEVGRRVAEMGVAQLFAIGRMASVMARAARDAGLNRVLEFADVETAALAVRSFVRTGDLLLVKASRGARLERISEGLRQGSRCREN
jgi:UDP-N-acetylmuramoyl-tripeptide--D-alanyl-D-alanine ligase